LGLAMWEESLAGRATHDDAAVAFARDLTPRLKNEYAKRLGGQWALTGQNLAPWYLQIATVRNRVVHGGFRPDAQEASEAMAALSLVEHFIGDQLAQKFRTYPRTAWLFLGAEGLRRRGRFSAANLWARSLDVPLQQAQLHWIDEYRAWRDQVNSLIQRRRT